MVRRIVLGSAACLLIVALQVTNALAKPKKHTFKATPDEVYQAALKVIAEHHKVQFANKEERLISFRSGMSMSSRGFECNASVETGKEPNETVLVINVQKTGGQIIAWGGGDRLAKDIFKWVQEELDKKATQKQAEPPPHH